MNRIYFVIKYFKSVHLLVMQPVLKFGSDYKPFQSDPSGMDVCTMYITSVHTITGPVNHLQYVPWVF